MFNNLPVSIIEEILTNFNKHERDILKKLNKTIHLLCERLNDQSTIHNELNYVNNLKHIRYLYMNNSSNLDYIDFDQIDNLRCLEYDHNSYSLGYNNNNRDTNSDSENNVNNIIKLIGVNKLKSLSLLNINNKKSINKVLSNIINIRHLKIVQNNSIELTNFETQLKYLVKLELNIKFTFPILKLLFNLRFEYLNKLSLVFQSQPLIDLVDLNPFFNLKLDPLLLPKLEDLSLISEQLNQDYYAYFNSYVNNSIEYNTMNNDSSLFSKLNITLPIKSPFINLKKVKIEPLNSNNFVELKYYFPKCERIELLPYEHNVVKQTNLLENINQFQYLKYLKLYTKNNEFSDVLFQNSQLKLSSLTQLDVIGFDLIQEHFFDFLFTHSHVSLPKLKVLNLSFVSFDFNNTIVKSINLHTSLRHCHCYEFTNKDIIPYLYLLFPKARFLIE
ncbi:hypothetical protein K502DRAFT_323447 [Neoconidiobolus thromboides FSU 785]|nr:hypothetical protein K502DRAFT_323447 [Neoconidiobolus thromboides FSU 785]